MAGGTIKPRDAKELRQAVEWALNEGFTLDVRGSGLRPDHKGVVLKGRDVVPGVSVINQRFVSSSLVQVMVKIEDSAAPGTYQLLLVDAQGQATSPRPLEVTK